MAKVYLVTLCLLCGFKCFAQSETDTLVSPVRTLSYKQYKSYTEGVDINNLALVADLNRYPKPEKVLDWKKELALTPAQITQVKNIDTEIHRKMKEMGAMIIKNEKALDDLLHSHRATDGELIFFTNRYGLYQGELRTAILLTYLKVNDILTAEQKAKYEKLLHP